MVFIENKTCIACLTCCFDSESSFRDPLDGSLAVEKGDEEKMRTNIDQTNGMLTSSIALSLTHNTRQSPPKLIFISCIFVNWKTISPLEIHFSLRKVTIFLERDAIKVLSCRDSHSHPQLSEKFHFSLPLNLSCAFLTDDPITPRM